MKSPQKRPRRQVFVLTPDEKRAAACVVGAFVLGLGTMYYRAKHPRPPAPTPKEQRETQRARSAAKAQRVSPAVSRSPAPTPSDAELSSDPDEE